jgi:hypothetical protein
MPDGTQISVSEGNYHFVYQAKGKLHAIQREGVQITKEVVGLQYWDGPNTKVFE